MNLVQSNRKGLSDEQIREAFSRFLQRETSDKLNFTHQRFECPFTGYSQESDAETFILSDYSNPAELPEEFRTFMEKYWEKLTLIVKQIELESLPQLRLSQAKSFVHERLGYQLTCTYIPANSVNYPKPKKDKSFLSTYPFGMQQGLSLEQQDQVQVSKKSDLVCCLPGYLLERMTGSQIEAIKNKPNETDLEDQWLFSVQSIPRPGYKVKIDGKFFNAEEYNEEYTNNNPA